MDPAKSSNWKSKFTLGFRMALDHTVPHKASRDELVWNAFGLTTLYGFAEIPI